MKYLVILGAIFVAVFAQNSGEIVDPDPDPTTSPTEIPETTTVTTTTRPDSTTSKPTISPTRPIISPPTTTELTPTPTDPTTTTEPPTCSADKRVVCTNCSAYIQCIPGLAQPLTLRCPSVAPFCNSNGRFNDYCDPDPDTDCTSEEIGNASGFMCTSFGFHPSPEDCSSYYYCKPSKVPARNSEERLIPTRGKCSNPTPYFDPDRRECTRATITSINCNRAPNIVSCRPNDEGVGKLFRSYRKHYYLCANQKPIVMQCPLMKEVDPRRVGYPDLCSYACPRAPMTYANPRNTSQYYECRFFGFLTLDRNRPRIVSCPQYHVYNEVSGSCVLEQSLLRDVDLETLKKNLKLKL